MAGLGLAAAFMMVAHAAHGVTTSVAADDSTPPPGSLIMSGPQSSRPAGTYSKGVTEIIRLLDAKVDGAVVTAYIQTANVPYQPEATELIALKEHGATADVQLALMSRSAELRQQYFKALQTMQAQATAARSAVASAPAAPTYADAQPVAYPESPGVSYVYPESYYAPFYGARYTYWPSLYCGFGFNWGWNNGRWCGNNNNRSCWNGDRSFGHVNNGVCWNGGFNSRFTPRTSHAAFAPVSTAPAVIHSGGGRSFSGGTHFASGGGGGIRAGRGR